MLSSVCIPYTCGAYLLAATIHVVKGSCPYHPQKAFEFFFFFLNVYLKSERTKAFSFSKLGS